MRKFWLFSVVLTAFLFSEIIYLKSQNQNEKQRDNFIKLTKISTFAFYPDEFCIRHYLNCENSEFFTLYPGFREFELGSFINSGLIK